MANSIDLVMRLLADDRASAAFKKVGAEAGKTGTAYEKFGSKARNALIGVGVGAFAASSVKAFAEVQDATSALTATYGETGQAFVDWSNKSADALNLSKREALGASQAFATYGKAAGLTGKQLESYVTPLVERAADAASYFGGSTADAVEAFGAALRGEMEPARRYGILLDDMTLRQTALKMGLIATTSQALTPQQKALVAQKLILEQTSQVQGDVARTSDSMANKIKDAQQQFDDLKVSVGETLSVAVGPMLTGLNSAVGAFNALPQPVKSVAVAVGVLGTATVILAPKIAATKVALAELGITAKGTGTKVLGLGKALTVAFAVGAAASAVNQTTEATIDLDKALGLLADNHWWDQFGTGIAHVFGATTTMDDAAAAVGVVDAKLAELVTGGNLEGAYKRFNELKASVQAAGGDVSNFDAQFTQYRAALDAATPKTAALAGAVAGVGEKAKTAADLVDDYKNAIDRLQGKTLDAKQRALQWKDALSGLAGTIKTNGKSLDENTDKGRANVEAMLSLIEQTNADAKANLDAGKSYDVVKAKHDQQIEALRKQAIKLGLNKDQVAALIAEFGKLPPKVTVPVTTPGLSTAASLAASLQTSLSKLPGKVGIAVTVNKRGEDAAHGHGKAAGGYMRAGQVSRVGEFGPELFVAPSSGRIVPNSAARAAGGSADMAQVVVMLDGKQVQTSLVTLKRRQGGNLAFQ